jgi:hypothetical protein
MGASPMPMPYALCPMPYALCPMPARAPHVTEKGYMSQINDLVNPPLLADRTSTRFNQKQIRFLVIRTFR